MDGVQEYNDYQLQGFRRFYQALTDNQSANNALAHLQNDFDSRVNLWLFCIWAGAQGYGKLSAHELTNLEKAYLPWHQAITLPLTHLQTTCDNYSAHRGLSLEVNKALGDSLAMEQYILVSQSQRVNKHKNPEKKLMDACKNWLTYCRQRQLSPGLISNSVYALFAAAFIDVPYERVQSYCDKYLIEAYPYGHQHAIWLA